MKAVVLPEYGEPAQLVLRDVPDPKPGAGEILVRVAGAGLNPVDWKQRSGHLRQRMPLELPAILGRDAAGHVVESGPGATAFPVGARVLGFVTRGYAELVVAAQNAWAEVPATLDLVDAAALPLVLLTGAQLVKKAVEPRAGDRVLVTGATGSVGRVAVYVAKALGCEVWAGVRKAHRADAARLGADGIVALDDDADLERLPLLDAIADTLGGETTPKLYGKLKAGGTIGSTVGEPAGAKERALVVRAFFTKPDARRLAELVVDVAEGKLVIPIVRRFPLAQAAQAHTLAEQGAGGEIVLTL